MVRGYLKNLALDAGRLALRGVERVQPELANQLRAEARRFLGIDPAPVSRPRPGPMQHDPATLPWLDRKDPDIEGYVRGLGATVANPAELEEQLRHWHRFGYVVLQGAIEPALVDAFNADVHELFGNLQRYSILLNSETRGIRPAREFRPEDLGERHLRILDFHNNSVAGKHIALHRKLVGFLGHVFREPVVAMQSLSFIHGSEQTTHQDLAYVVPGISSHLAATWVALEDIGPEAGPLGYYPGSHTLPTFNFGNGMHMTPESKFNELDFARHLEAEAQKAGLELKTFLPRKGDVFVWHGALAHRGCPQNDPSLTRRAFATHYSTVRAYPFDRRQHGVKPTEHALNGAVAYANPRNPAEEDIFPRKARF